jgi:hypothetical protein
MNTPGWIYLLMLAGLAGFVFGILDRRRWAERHAHEIASVHIISLLDSLLPDVPRYEITVTDWGPDFTGVSGVLPRWRWTVFNADWRVIEEKRSDRTEPQVGHPSTPYMLGNDGTAADAWMSALKWIEEQNHPYVVFTPPGPQTNQIDRRPH